MKEIKLYTTQYCPYCTQAKRLLESKNLEFKEIDLTDDPDLRSKIQEETGWMTVPMIFVGDEFIGGAQELGAINDSGDLDIKLGLK